MIHRSLATVALGATLVLGLAACGSSGSGSPAPATQTSPGATARGGPAASGTIASVGSSDIEVQNPSAGQVTVNFAADTTFTHRVSGTLTDVTQGSCVLVTGNGQPIVAQSVEISPAMPNGCAAGPGGGGARPRNGNGNGSRPPRPSGANGQNRGFAAGKVVSVTGTGFTVEEDNAQTGATSDVEVTVDPNTTYLKSEAANASALKVGECVSATGQTDDSGAVTARTITISQAGPNGCATGGRQRGTGSANGNENGSSGNGNG